MKFKEMTKEQRDRIVLKALAVLLAAVGLYMFGLRPLVARIREDEARIQALDMQTARADRLIRQEAALRAEAERLRETMRDRLAHHLPPKENPLLWATQIVYRHAAVHGIEIRSIAEESIQTPAWIRPADAPETPRAARGGTEPPQAWRSLAPFAVQVALEAPFPGILMMIAGLESEQTLLNISSLNIQSATREPELQTARLSLQWPRRVVPFDDRISSFLSAVPGEDAP